MHFSANFGQIIVWRPLWKILDPPLQKPLEFYFAQRESISTSLFSIHTSGGGALNRDTVEAALWTRVFTFADAAG